MRNDAIIPYILDEGIMHLMDACNHLHDGVEGVNTPNYA